MCKVLMISNFSKVTNKKLFIDTAFELITATDDDGFGYAIQGKRGVYGEKTLNPNWKHGSKVHPFMNDSQDQKFGIESPTVGAALFHGRTSTNQINLLNTHPIQKHDWTLIHNGVVSNRGDQYDMQTSNDTEHVLHYLANHGISGVAQNLTGYYAVGAFSPDGKLHIIRDNTASLYSCYSETLKSFIFGTTADLIKDLCAALSLKRGAIREYNKSTYTVMKGNKVLSCETFQPRGYGYSESSYADKSLGRILETEDFEPQVEESEIEATKEPTFADYVEGTRLPTSARVFDADGYEIEAWEFRQLDYVSRMLCSIWLADSTVLQADERDLKDAEADAIAGIRG